AEPRPVEPRLGERERRAREDAAGSEHRRDEAEAQARGRQARRAPPVRDGETWQPRDVDEHVDPRGGEPDDEARLVEPEDDPAGGAADEQRNACGEDERRRDDDDRRDDQPHQRVQRPLQPVRARAGVVAGEARAGRAELQGHRRHEHQPDEDVDREERPQEEDRHALRREQQDEHDRGRRGQPLVSLCAARPEHAASPAAGRETAMRASPAAHLYPRQWLRADPGRRGRGEDGVAPRPRTARGEPCRRRGRQRRGRALDGDGDTVRRDRPRRDAPRARRARGLPAAARARRLDARPDPDRARRRRRSRGGPGHGRRRLPREAVLVLRAARSPAGAGAARAGRATRRARDRRPATRPGDAPGVARRRRRGALCEGVRPPRGLHAPAGRDAQPAPPARGRVGHGLREPLEPRRRLRRLPAPEDRPAVRPQVARDRPRRRLPPARRRPVSSLPLRVRLTLAFAVVMAVVLAAMGLFVYLRVGGALLTSVDQSLRAGAAETAGHLARDEEGDAPLVDPDAARGETLAQLLDASGRVLRSQPAGLARLLDRNAVTGLRPGRPLLSTTELPGRKHEWRLLATRLPTDRGAASVLVLASSLASREETLRRLLGELALGGALALLLASLAGYGLASGALRPVEAMRRRAAAISASTPGRRLPVPQARDEIGRLAETLNGMLARLEGALEHERRFVADASHELRTPLALLRTELEVALRRRRSHEELEAALRSASEETERLTRLAEDLLLIARSDQEPLPLRREVVDAEELMETVVSRFTAR